MSQSFTNLIYHLIFSTKDRRPLITLEYQPRLYDYIGGILRNTGGVSLGIDGVEDHVHVLAKLRPEKAVSDVLRDLKANASGWMHDVFPATVGLLLATWVRSIHSKSITCGNGSKVSGATEGASSEDFVSRRVPFVLESQRNRIRRTTRVIRDLFRPLRGLSEMKRTQS